MSVPHLLYEGTDLVYKLLQERSCCVICKRSQIPQTLQRISYWLVHFRCRYVYTFTHCKWRHWTDLLEQVCMHMNIVAIVLQKVVVGHVG